MLFAVPAEIDAESQLSLSVSQSISTPMPIAISIWIDNQLPQGKRIGSAVLFDFRNFNDLINNEGVFTHTW